jgi:predicted secreted Zn-dependent protease
LGRSVGENEPAWQRNFDDRLDSKSMFLFCSHLHWPKLRRQQVKMVYAFDTLAYSKRLRDKGVPQEQAEAHAEAIREFVMADLATKADLQALRSDLQAISARVDAKLDHFDAKLDQFEAKLDTLSLRLTVRLGTMLVVGLGALATILKHT